MKHQNLNDTKPLINHNAILTEYIRREEPRLCRWVVVQE
jgi:hypothetical protein